MEATKLKPKKQINKGKLKKSMKLIICRPDAPFWPQISEDESNTLKEALNSIKVDIPHFKKPLWSELSHIPKDSRPKAPPIPKVEGLIFGISQCQKAIENKECIGVLIEAAVNPKSIVQPLIEMCSCKSVPVLCLKELRSLTKVNFGIPASVLGIQQNCSSDLEKKIHELYKCHKPAKKPTATKIDEEMIIDSELKDVENETSCPYLYRTDKKSRVFTPLLQETSGDSNKFVGQNFIKLSNSSHNDTIDSKQFMKMIVKKISSNPNRRKISKVNSKK